MIDSVFWWTGALLYISVLSFIAYVVLNVLYFNITRAAAHTYIFNKAAKLYGVDVVVHKEKQGRFLLIRYFLNSLFKLRLGGEISGLYYYCDFRGYWPKVSLIGTAAKDFIEEEDGF